MSNSYVLLLTKDDRSLTHAEHSQELFYDSQTHLQSRRQSYSGDYTACLLEKDLLYIC